jgi:carbonic anhydrase
MSDDSAGERASDGARTSDEQLTSLLAGLESGARRPSPADGRGAERTLVLACSMGPQGNGVSLWPVESTAGVTTVRTLGNQTWERQDGRRALDGRLAQRTDERDVGAVLVVGHTGCDVVADAHERCLGSATGSHAGIEARLEPIVEVVRRAVDAGLVEATTPPRATRYRLVEYNVRRQVQFLTDRLPDRTTVAGYVHDEDGAYSSFPGRTYLVALEDAVGTAAESRLPEDTSVPVASLLSPSPPRP